LNPSAEVPAPHASPSVWALFTAFLRIGILGFGGVAAFARHVLVVERGFLSERDFAEMFGVSSTLPGANTVNMATMLGDRYRGVAGAGAAVLGLLGMPLLILVGVATLYTGFSGVPEVRAGLSGAAAGAAGLVIGTSLKILQGLEPDAVTWATAGAVFLAAAGLRLPMLLILAIAIPVSLATAAARRRTSGKGGLKP
jgi:chromate transporter